MLSMILNFEKKKENKIKIVEETNESELIIIL